MSVSELINEILSEWAYRIDDGMPNPKNPTHINELGTILSEMGLSSIKNELLENLEEEEKQFKNPILNKEIPYKSNDGSEKKGLVGNLLRLPKEHPGRKAAENLLPPEGSDERNALNKDLGSEKDGKSGAEAPVAGDKNADGDQPAQGGDDASAKDAEKEKQKQTQAMFTADPAMTSRLDIEKDTLAKIADTNKEADKANNANVITHPSGEEKQKPTEETEEFKPIPAADVNTEMPQADPDTFGGGTDIPDGVEPEELEKFNTDIKQVQRIVAKAKENNQPIPDINLCQITIPGTNLYCDDNLGIPRDQMPQFKGKAVPGSRAASMPTDKNGEVDTEPIFKKMLEEKGIKVLQTEVPADKLKATQKDLVGGKVVGMMGALEEDPKNPNITAPIYVSRDGFVIDGHHRWAAIVAYNAQHPDAQIPMKTTVLDMDIKDAIPMCNKFAEDMGVAVKKADANKEGGNTPKEIKGESKTFKGNLSGKEIKSIDYGDGAQVFGVEHGNKKMVDDIINNVKSSIPKDKWKDIVFLGEGGASGENGEMEFQDEVAHAANQFKKIGAGIDSWDGDDMDVHNDQSKLYQKQKEKTGLSDTEIKAGNWASMIGQGEGTDTMSPDDYLDDKGKQFLQNSAKEAGLPQIENWDNPTDEDKDTLYRLSFPEDNGDTETKVNDIQVAFNKARDENLLEKTKELKAKGKIPITIAGEGHVDLLNGKKANENTGQMKEELLPLVDTLIAEIINGYVSEFLIETNFPPGPKGLFWVRNKQSKEVYLVKTPREAVHEKPSPKQIATAEDDLKAQLKKKKVQAKPANKKVAAAPVTGFRQNPKEKDIVKTTTTAPTQTSNGPSQLELKYQNENAVTQMLSRDKKAQIRWMNGEETAPGTDAGAFNEVFGMTVAALIRKNPNITDAEIEKKIRRIADAGSVTKDLKVSGGDKMTAAIQTGRAINQRTSEIAEEERYDPKTLTQTGYWGSAASKASAIAQLAEMVKKNPKIRFNGLTFEQYKKIILEGGGGEDPTDTMIVIHDGKSNNVAILHVSNKIGSNNIQANSTVKFTYIRAIDILDKLQVPGKDKEQAYNFIKKHEAIGGRLQKEQKKYINSFLGEFANLGVQNPKQFAKDIYADKDAGGQIRRGDEVDKAFKKNGAIGKACNGGKVKNKETGKLDIREPFKPEGTIACSLIDNPKATPEQKAVALFQYYYALGESDRTDIEVPSFVREIVARSQDVKRDGKRVYDMGYDEKKVNELYGKMADELEGMRQDLNSIIPGMGDTILAQDIVERLHLGITEEDHLKNGIPSNRFMLVMGNNEAGNIFYDKSGQGYEKKDKGYYKINDDGTTDKNPTPLKQSEVNRGNIATVGNAENFKNCLGVPKGQHVRQSINIKYEPVNLETGIINAHVFDINGVEKAVLVIRTKTGPGGDANDTVQFSKEMQSCMQKQEYLKKRRRNRK